MLTTTLNPLMKLLPAASSTKTGQVRIDGCGGYLYVSREGCCEMQREAQYQDQEL